MVATHCPSVSAGTLNAGQLPVPGVPGLGTVQVPSTVDGVFVLLHGLSESPLPSPFGPVNVGGFLPSFMGSWAADLLADNWVVIHPEHPEDGYATTPIAGLYADLVSATSNGGQQLVDTTMSWFTHVVALRDANWPGKKIAVGGFSEGGFLSILLGKMRHADIIGGVAHCPATIWENLPSGLTAPYNFGALSLPNFDLDAHALDACPVPFMVSYGTNDSIVGWQNPGGSLPTSNTDAIITNAVAAGMPVTRNATTDGHEVLAADVTTFMSYITGTLDPRR